MTVILLTTLLTLSALYAPQPLLPAIMEAFDVSRGAAAFLTTITFIPLALAPLFYGYLLETRPPRQILRVGVLLLACSEILFCAGPSYYFLLGVRLVQGLLVPAILTSLMTYVATHARKGEMQRAMSLYIAATTLGGFLGRAISGLIAGWLGWRASFLLLGLSLAGISFLLRNLSKAAPQNLAKPTAKDVLQLLADPFRLRVYLLVFCFFCSFASVMNFIPFRLTELSSDTDTLRIGLSYTGYLMGIASALCTPAIIARLGSEGRALALGLSGMALAIGVMHTSSVTILFAVMFLFCASMFLVHTTASGLVNRMAGSHKGLVNGIYIAFYYTGGAVGSYVPGLFYARCGWAVFLHALLAVVLSGLGIALWTCRCNKLA